MANENVRIENIERATEAAYECMVNQGIQATTRELISKITGISMASIARYFPTKADMVMAAAARGVDKSMKFNSIRFTGSGFHRIQMYLNVICKEFFKHPEVFSFRADVICYMHYYNPWYLDRIIKPGPHHNRLKDFFEMGFADGSVKKIGMDANEAATYYHNLLFGYLSDLALKNSLRDSESVTRVRNNLKHYIESIEVEIRGNGLVAETE